MKKLILTLGGLAALFIFLFARNTVNKESNDIELKSKIQNLPIIKKGNGFALVELFTSEGCSSCPPADALVSKVAKEKNDNVFILAYHVDYWNRLGWKDKFSKAEFSKRQQDYAGLLNLDGAYTPQIVVNGKTQFVGSDEEKLYSAINKTIENTASAQITISASVVNNQILVKYKADEKSNSVLNFALVQLAGSSQVKNGENEGKFLPYFSRIIDTEDARYTVVDDSLEIEQISISGSKGFAYGNFTWDFYAGCIDLNSTDEQDVDISFEISGNTLLFDIELPIIWRSDED